MRKNIAKVIEAFRNGVEATGDSKRTCYTDGITVWSYSWKIAERRRNGTIAIVKREASPSRTTTAQIDALDRAFPGAKRFDAERPNVPTGGSAYR